MSAPAPPRVSAASSLRAPSASAPQRVAAPQPLKLDLLEVKKLSQLIGDYDKHLKQPVTGKTHEKAGVLGADRGSPFDDGERVLFLFGDTIGTEAEEGADAIGFTQDTNPDDGVALDFYARPDGKFLPFRPLGKDGKETPLPSFEGPVAGVRIGDLTYVAFTDNHAGDGDGAKDEEQRAADQTDVTHLARFDRASGQATTLCEISRQPAGKFHKLSFRAPVDTAGLPDGGPWVLMVGTGKHRASDVYLGIIPVLSLASCAGIRYWVRSENGKPVWSDREADAEALFTSGAERGTVGDLSLSYAEAIRRFLLVYDAADQGRKVYLRHAETPWGPFSEPMMVFNPAASGFGVFIHDPRVKPGDGQAGPMPGQHKAHPEKVRGGLYAPFVVERWTQRRQDTLSIYFLISVWNPYTVELMRADFGL